MILTKPARPPAIVKPSLSGSDTKPVSKAPKPIKIVSVANGIIHGTLRISWQVKGKGKDAKKAIKLSLMGNDGWHHWVLGINLKTLRYLSKYKNEEGTIDLKGLFLVYPKSIKGKLGYQIVAHNPSTAWTESGEFLIQGTVQSVEQSKLKGCQTVSVRIKPQWSPTEEESKRPNNLQPFTVDVQMPNKMVSGIIQVGNPVSMVADLDRAYLMFKRFRPELIQPNKLV